MKWTLRLGAGVAATLLLFGCSGESEPSPTFVPQPQAPVPWENQEPAEAPVAPAPAPPAPEPARPVLGDYDGNGVPDDLENDTDGDGFADEFDDRPYSACGEWDYSQFRNDC